jgi:hypothetical protein
MWHVVLVMLIGRRQGRKVIAGWGGACAACSKPLAAATDNVVTAEA